MRLSYSSINTYETCPAKFKFQYEDRAAARRAPPRCRSATRCTGRCTGSTTGRCRSPPSLEELHEMLDGVWVSEGYRRRGRGATYRDHARQVLPQYHRENADRVPHPGRARVPVHHRGRGRAALRRDRPHGPDPGRRLRDHRLQDQPPAAAAGRGSTRTSSCRSTTWPRSEIWGIEPERLTLYYLLPGQRMTTVRTPADVDELRRRIAVVAERIEAGKFEPRQNPLCDWCDYQARCPLFRHRYEKEQGDPAPSMTRDRGRVDRLKREDSRGVPAARRARCR